MTRRTRGSQPLGAENRAALGGAGTNRVWARPAVALGGGVGLGFILQASRLDQPANEYNDKNIFVVGSTHNEVAGVEVEANASRQLRSI